MPIEALPKDTTRAIGSSLVLTDAKSVVKELVDNALDARATAISVEISANTLDVVQIKDNGTGIGAQDRQLLCKRGCTSKISTIEDLERLGGTFLGFRGEALASIVELSQAVVISTRVDGEIAGTAIKYDISGMISSSSASHSVGTTIRVQDFLTKIPVRKQTALKAATKTLEAIKSLLFAYAFARPEVRFSLKVLKGKIDKLNWTYAASPNQSVAEVATKIVGKEISSICTPYTVSSDDCDVTIDPGWSINALLISGDADSSKVRSTSQYVSIDGRPVSPERRTMKEIAKSYKRHVRKSILSATGHSVSRPFLFMHIRCPSQSYDVNIEPAKDEVLFLPHRADQLLSLAECLFSRAYPKDAAQEEKDTANTNDTVSPRDSSMFNKDMLRAFPDDLVLEAGGIAAREEGADSHEVPLQTASSKTPWTITAMNTIIKPKTTNTTRASTSSETCTTASPDTQAEDTLEGAPQFNTRPRVSPSSEIGDSTSTLMSDTSRPPSPRPGPPLRRRVKISHGTENEAPTPQAPHIRNRNLAPQQTVMQTWLTPDLDVHRPMDLGVPLPDPSTPGSMPEPTTPGTPNFNVITPAYHDVPSSSQMGRRWGGGQKAFKVPSKRKSRGQLPAGFPPTPPSSIHDGPEANLRSNLRGMPVHPKVSDGDYMLPEANAELDDIMEFEHRKKAVIAKHKRLAARFPPASQMLNGSNQFEMSGALSSGGIDRTSREASLMEDYDAPFGDSRRVANTSRHRKAVRDPSHSHPEEGEESGSMINTIEEGRLSGPNAITTPEKPSLAPTDPRAYLLRQQQRPSQGKLHRTKSSKLPLESMLPGSVTFNLIVTVDVLPDIEHIRNHTQQISSIDVYLQHGKIEYTNLNSMDVSTSPDWAYSLRNLITTNYRGTGTDGQELIPESLSLISKSF